MATEISKFEKKMQKLTESILKDYEGKRDIDDLHGFDNPDKETIEEILLNLQRVIFPGYFKNKFYRIYTVRNNLTMLLEDVYFHLSKQIGIALKYRKEYTNETQEKIQAKAENITQTFLERIPKMRACIQTDVEAAYDGDPAAYNIPEIIFSYPGLHAIMVHRIAHELHSLNVPLIPRIMSEYVHCLTGIDIHPGATIGKYFFIDHGTGIVIGETTKIGNHVKMYQGVTLGGLSTRDSEALKNKKRHPTIEDNVVLYAGATVLGGKTIIGENAVIGGNVFLTQSVPKGAKVSLKDPELRIKLDEKTEVKHEELKQKKEWYYVI